MDKGGGGEDKVFNPEPAEYELCITVTGDNGEFIELFVELNKLFVALNDCNTRENLTSSHAVEFECTHQTHEQTGQNITEEITNDKLLQFVPVEIIGNVKSVVLRWDDDVMERVLLEIFCFEDVQELRIESNEPEDQSFCLRHLPPEIGDLKNLRILEIFSFLLLEDLPSAIGKLENLEELTLLQCESLKHLPSDIGHLKRLQRLDISECFKLEDLPPTIGNLESLEELSIFNCENLKQLPSEISNLRSLQKLMTQDIDLSWNNMEDFILGCTNLESLQEMLIFSCKSLINFPPEIGNLRCLQTLFIQHCRNLKKIPSEIGNLESLQEMKIIGCPLIDKLPPEIGRLRCLRELHITEDFDQDYQFKFIPLEVGNLLSLQKLSISYSGWSIWLLLSTNSGAVFNT